MIKWFAYIVFLLILTPCLSLAKIRVHRDASTSIGHIIHRYPSDNISADTTSKNNKQKKQQEQDDKKKVKEVTKAKRLPKPEKLDEDTDPNSSKKKAKRQRRPPGLERPPEIPRRNGN